MHVEWNGTTIVISPYPTSSSYVVIGVRSIRFYTKASFEARRVKDPFKPHMDYTMGDMLALFEELKSIPE